MLCRVEMPSNEATYGRFYRYRVLHLSGSKTPIVLYIVLPIVSAAFAVFMFLTNGSPLFFGGIAVILAAMGIYTLYIKPGQQFRKKEGAALQTEVYIFTDNGFTRSVRSEEGGLPDNTSAQYDVLVGAVETGKDFFLLTGPQQGYIVDKEYFTKGGPDELRDTLLKKLGKKFKTKK